MEVDEAGIQKVVVAAVDDEAWDGVGADTSVVAEACGDGKGTVEERGVEA